MRTLSAPLLALLLAAAPASAQYLAYVSNEHDGTVTIIDVARDSAISVIRVGSHPRGIHVSPDGRRVYVALSDTARQSESAADAIAVIDVVERRLVARIPAGSDPEQFALSPDGRTLYAANEDAGTASIVDLENRRVLATLPVGIEPEGVGISPDGRWVYITAETSNTVSVIDTRAREVAQSFLVDVRPRAAAFSPDGTRAYVTAEIGGTVAIVDAATHQVLDVVPVGGGEAKPVGVAVAEDGRVYVANGRAGTVSVLARDGAALATIRVGSRPWGIALTPDGRRLLTANGASHDVSVIDVASLSVVATIRVGRGPWGVAIGLDPGFERR